MDHSFHNLLFKQTHLGTGWTKIVIKAVFTCLSAMCLCICESGYFGYLPVLVWLTVCLSIHLPVHLLHTCASVCVYLSGCCLFVHYGSVCLPVCVVCLHLCTCWLVCLCVCPACASLSVRCLCICVGVVAICLPLSACLCIRGRDSEQGMGAEPEPPTITQLGTEPARVEFCDSLGSLAEEEKGRARVDGHPHFPFPWPFDPLPPSDS